VANPKRIVEAFVPVGNDRGGLDMAEFTPGRLLLLERIEHPLARDAKPGEARPPLSNEEVMQALFVLVKPVAVSLGLLRQGWEAFETGVYEFADGIPMRELPMYAARIKAALIRATSTAAAATEATGGSERPAGELPKHSGSSPSATSEDPALAGT
jgi:hypothetical protein